MTKLSSIDLFSGIGGLTLALHGIATPKLYCEIDDNAVAVLQANMRRGKLPRAPIHRDIRKLHSVPRADIIVGGFPCIGFSASGLRNGFGNDQSRLFFDMLRVIDVSGASAVFLENVPGVMRIAGGEILHELSAKRGFELRWMSMSAADVGAPQIRSRWFCLGTKRGCPLHTMRFRCSAGGYVPKGWRRGSGVKYQRLFHVKGEELQKIRGRIALLGNAVVPDVARTAFCALVSMGECTSLCRNDVVTYNSGPPPENDNTGTTTTTKTIHIARGLEDVKSYKVAIVSTQNTNAELQMDPGLMKGSTQRPNSNQTAKVFTRPFTRKLWPTPRHGHTHVCNVLTDRTQRDLPTTVRFEKHTRDRNGSGLDPRFVEWLMGFDINYTLTS
jgi:DNA-cytosine methyltransferase